MKKLIVIISLMSTWQLHAQTYQLDLRSSSCTWRGYAEIGHFYQEGEISFREGEIVIEEGMVVDGVMIFDMQSITTPDSKLLDHLKGPDFFHTKKYEEATFTMNRSPTSSVEGFLKIRDKIHPQTFEGIWVSSDSLINISGTTLFDRTLYDIKYNSNRFFQDLGSYAIKDTISLQCELKLNLKK